jgi:GDP-L-fucose synthase
MHSHVLPAMIQKMHLAKVNKEKEVIIWGSGKPLREFLYSKDLADACIYLMNHYSGNETVNVGTGKEITIAQLAYLIQEIVGFEGTLVFDQTKPDGTPRKLLDVSKLESLGWTYQTKLKDGIRLAYEDYLSRL